jgi:hypothetical protein
MQLFIRKFYCAHIFGSLIASVTKAVNGKVKVLPPRGHTSPGGVEV